MVKFRVKSDIPKQKNGVLMRGGALMSVNTMMSGLAQIGSDWLKWDKSPSQNV